MFVAPFKPGEKGEGGGKKGCKGEAKRRRVLPAQKKNKQKEKTHPGAGPAAGAVVGDGLEGDATGAHGAGEGRLLQARKLHLPR